MTADPKGRGLFIVDNSISGWTGLRYLEEWAGIAKAFDIATGYFEIGAVLALDGQWQALRPHSDSDGRRDDVPHAHGAARRCAGARGADPRWEP